jgi:hypothetical protein
MSNNQIISLAAAKRANPVISIYSPTDGIVDGTQVWQQAQRLACKAQQRQQR